MDDTPKPALTDLNQTRNITWQMRSEVLDVVSCVIVSQGAREWENIKVETLNIYYL